MTTAKDWNGHAPDMRYVTSEAQLLQLVVRKCDDLQLTYHHSTDSRRDLGRGFPDLVILNRATGQLFYAELKAARGHLDADQCQWKWSLIAGGHTWYQWRPADWDAGIIQDILGQLAGKEEAA
jgi:hypothetical protein